MLSIDEINKLEEEYTKLKKDNYSKTMSLKYCVEKIEQLLADVKSVVGNEVNNGN